MKAVWNNLRRHVRASGVFFLLIGSALISAGLCVGLWWFPQYARHIGLVIPYLAGISAAVVGVLLLLSSRIGAKKYPRDVPSPLPEGRVARLVEKYYRWTLSLAVLLAVFQIFMYFLDAMVMNSGIVARLTVVQQDRIYWAVVGPLFAVPLSLVLLLIFWLIRLVVRRKADPRKSPPGTTCVGTSEK